MTATVKRWDIHDIADELADVPVLLRASLDDFDTIGAKLGEAARKIKDLERRLWLASAVGGCVGPAPEYHRHTPTEA
ncbi:hypothetical protein A5630_25445 [Mycolicibacterium mucogenicum]|uniref:Uncharacterized protein n=1 Tax=Mycolicibacterium mucogenicum TaxID=56689 RepID=A0A1A3GY85_MYCMU|nr:hypothetical protein [Mycolicibacterium mucogenicum]OBJ40299.1 hypothetical protein A5630_25445 [Mycolicibacterium mucogenicum]